MEGKEYEIHELMNYFMNIDQYEENKTSNWWYRVEFKRYPYQTGFMRGISIGQKLMNGEVKIKKEEVKNG